MSREEIEALEKQHEAEPHLRLLQKAIAKELTIRVHSEEDYQAAVEASDILFGKGTTESLKHLSEKMFLAVFEGVPQCEVAKADIEAGVNVVDFLAEKTTVFASKGEARRMLKSNGVAINKQKVNDTYTVSAADLINERYILVQKGKKDYYVIKTA